MKIALAQINTRLGDVDANLKKHLEYIQQARAAGADLIIFPELSLTGYYLMDLAQNAARPASADDPAFAALLEASRGIDIVVGFAERDERKRIYISAAYLSEGKFAHVHRKIYLPTYGMFDDARFFKPGDSVRAFDTRLGRMGMLICEDIWHASPPYLLWLDGAELLIFISASPGRGLTESPKLESERWVEHINQAYASLFTCFVASTNRVGFEDGIHFYGGATAYDPEGTLLAEGPSHEEALTFAELDMKQIQRTRARLPLLRDERPEIVERELGRILGKGTKRAEVKETKGTKGAKAKRKKGSRG